MADVTYIDYSTDPPTIISREYTEDEKAQNQCDLEDALLAAQRALNISSNRNSLNLFAENKVKNLIEDIGPAKTLPNGSPNPALIPGPTSFNAILADTKANINANPTPYINFLARSLKTTDKTLLAIIKLLRNMVDDVNLGAE